ncbi:hypothetical protein BDZ94DRAFT_621664 [Collybia nuda]|uniref:Uncharacterized protein n=1 Tax=Collybia nuda TaxID=64659 RepID=A0A9P5Y633_9AGAR|nr:hypothetical protein BDZ94DRAFT_621664 [Collybia nuda]
MVTFGFLAVCLTSYVLFIEQRLHSKFCLMFSCFINVSYIPKNSYMPYHHSCLFSISIYLVS